MNEQDKQFAMGEIASLIQSDKKIEAIKKIIELFGYSLKQGKAFAEEMQSTANFRYEYYEQKLEQVIKSTFASRCFSTLFILIVISGFVLLILYFATDFFPPQAYFQYITVELENGEVYETTYSRICAVNKKEELLIDYDAGNLEFFIALHLDTYYDFRDYGDAILGSHMSAGSYNGWIIENTDNPYYFGKLKNQTNRQSYYISEKVYDSATAYHFVDRFYTQNGTLVWTHSSNDTSDKLFQNVITATTNFNGETTSKTIKYLNVNKFLEQKYDLVVRTTYNEGTKCLTFVIKHKAQSPQVG